MAELVLRNDFCNLYSIANKPVIYSRFLLNESDGCNRLLFVDSVMGC